MFIWDTALWEPLSGLKGCIEVRHANASQNSPFQETWFCRERTMGSLCLASSQTLFNMSLPFTDFNLYPFPFTNCNCGYNSLSEFWVLLANCWTWEWSKKPLELAVSIRTKGSLVEDGAPSNFLAGLQLLIPISDLSASFFLFYFLQLCHVIA